MTTRNVSSAALSASLVLGAVLSLFVSYRIATQSILMGSREGRWIYPYIQPVTLRPLAIGLLVTLLAGLLMALRDRIDRRGEWANLASWVLVAMLFDGLLRSLTPYTFENIFTSDGANAFYGVARHYTLETALADFAGTRTDWPLHAQSNMPGKLVLVYALKSISKRPDVLPWLVVLLSNIGGLLMYLFARDLFADRKIALNSMVLYLFVPARLFFFPLMNVVTPVVVLACAVLVLRWGRTGNTIYPVMLGVVLYLMVFFEPLPLVMGLLFAALLHRSWRRGDISAPRLLWQAGAVAAAFLVAYSFVLARTQFNLLDGFRLVAAHAAAFNLEAQRPYAVWVRQNLREFLFGVGVCQVVLFVAAMAHGVRRAESWHSWSRQPITMLCFALLAVLLAVDLIGVNRGEVIRLWIFLACFFQIPAAYVCAQLDSRAAMALVVGTTVLQVALGTATIGFIVP